MPHQFDSMARIPVLRADQFPHGDGLPLTDSGPVHALHVDHIAVDTDVREGGRVTVAGSNPDPCSDSCGVEFDMTPGAARMLAAQLVAAAETCEPSATPR